MTRGRRRAWILLVVAVLMSTTAFATFGVGLDRQALWQVVRACVADFQATGAPFPCLEVDLSGGEERGAVVLRPPLLHETILAPTRKIVGIEDPFLQSPDAPNYFSDAWRAQSFLKSAGGRRPDRDEVALIVNSALVRGQDQLHIHMGCLLPYAQRAIAAGAPSIPIGEWAPFGPVIPHTAFWATRVRGTDLTDVEPFRLAAEGLADKVRDRARMMLMVAGVRVAGDDGFLILATYAGAPHAWWQVGSGDLLVGHCPDKSTLSG